MALAVLQRILRVVAPTPARAVRLFVAANIGFLGLDIAIAHLANDFARRQEWTPVVFSAVGTLLLLPGALGAKQTLFRQVDRFVAVGAIAVGLLGMLLHLRSGFFDERTLHQLVYSAPFVAPLAYVGVGLLLVLVHSDDVATPRFGWWVVLLALAGFVGNFALSLLDHAQNGFFRATEWIPVGAAAYAIGFLGVALAEAPKTSTAFVRLCLLVMGLEMLVGVLGAALHVNANLHESVMSTMRDKFVFGAPAFAPLLFANLALLAMIGLWAVASDVRSCR